MASEATAGIGVGTVVADSYEVTGLLGRGGMGAVWLAQHRRLPGKRVAIKVLLAGAGDPQALGRFRREAEVVSRIGHPNIVEVLDFNTLADGTPYQVLEYLPGESLGARLRRERLSTSVALELARQMGSALQAAHRAGVVHRDLKPENILLLRSDAGGVVHDRVKVLDFGISKIRGSQTLQTQESVLIGTPQYMSPEQASGKNQTVDHRTDIFALGAIVYEMLSGKTAFAGDSLVAVVMEIVEGTPQPLGQLVPGLPAGVVAAVERALAKDPGARWQQVGDFIGALTGRPLETLDQTTTVGTPVAGSARPLSQEEVMGATQMPGTGTSEGPPPTSVTATSAREATPVTTPVAGGGTLPARRGKSPLAALAALAVAGALAGVYLVGRRGAEVGAGGTAVSPAAVQGGAAPVPRVEPPAAKIGPAATKTVPAPAKSEPAGGKDEPPARDEPPREEKEEPPPPAEAAAHLAEAERSLERGDANEAIRRARQSFFVRKTNRGWALLTRAFCRKGDLGNARASFQNVRRGSPERMRVLRECRRMDVDLR